MTYPTSGKGGGEKKMSDMRMKEEGREGKLLTFDICGSKFQ